MRECVAAFLRPSEGAVVDISVQFFTKRPAVVFHATTGPREQNDQPKRALTQRKMMKINVDRLGKDTASQWPGMLRHKRPDPNYSPLSINNLKANCVCACVIHPHPPSTTPATTTTRLCRRRRRPQNPGLWRPSRRMGTGPGVSHCYLVHLTCIAYLCALHN